MNAYARPRAGGGLPPDGARSPEVAACAGTRTGGLRLAGYAALFGIADAAGDTIRPGAFARTLAERRAGLLGPLPLLWQHRAGARIGWVERVSEDARGLRIVARLDNLDHRAAAMLRTHSVNGLSFGYHARAASRSGAGRLLEEIELVEISLVTHPLQPAARVHFVSP
ncbi:MAG: HK97 family phage prohead protease [Cypionkella sp.]